MRQREIVLWVDERWCHALEKYLPGGDVSKKLERHLETLIAQLPEAVHEKISQEIRQEDEQAKQEQEAARRFTVFRVTEDGITDQFLLERDGDTLYAARWMRDYLRRQKEQPTRFSEQFHRAVLITPEQFDTYVSERLENTGRVTGVFEIDLDKGLFSGLHIMDGWKVYRVKDVSAAVYHAFRKQGRSYERQLECFQEKLAGKELTAEEKSPYLSGSRRLRPEEIGFDGEVMECSGKLNFYVPVYFDPDTVFGVNVTTEDNDDYINVYANYDLRTGRVCPDLEITLYRGDGSQSEHRYRLTASDCKTLLPKMEAYSRRQAKMSLLDWRKEYAEGADREGTSQ